MLWYRTGYTGFLPYMALINLPLWPSGRVCVPCRCCCCAVCFFRIVPVLVRGSRRIVVWYNVLVCCVLSRSQWCGMLPGRVPGALLSFTVLLHSICSRWYSRRRDPRFAACSGSLFPDTFPGSRFAFLFPAACCPSVAFRCLLAFFPTTIVLHYSGVLVRFLFKYQCFRGVPEKRLKNLVKTC